MAFKRKRTCACLKLLNDKTFIHEIRKELCIEIFINTVKPVLRGHFWDQEKMAL
jgi:hypothetical protein